MGFRWCLTVFSSLFPSSAIIIVYAAMPAAPSAPSVTDPKLIRSLPPLPIHGDDESFTSPVPSVHASGDDQIHGSVLCTGPLSPPPMYSDDKPFDWSRLTRPLPPLPICREGQPAVSFVLSTSESSTRSWPLPPISSDTLVPLSSSSTSTLRALPLPPLSSISTGSARPLPPPPHAGSKIKPPGQLMIV